LPSPAFFGPKNRPLGDHFRVSPLAQDRQAVRAVSLTVNARRRSCRPAPRGRSLVVKLLPSKQVSSVRFRPPAPAFAKPAPGVPSCRFETLARGEGCPP